MARHTQCSSPKVGDWLKGKIVGSGSFGTVHLAMNKTNGALFVVKSSNSEGGIQSLENEANILENLNSPYIVRCIGKELEKASGERKLNLFIEYMCGGSLADISKKFGGALDENVVRLYTRAILRGLKYLRENGIVHCDIKCKNVLLGSSGNIKMADFGCAKRVKDLKKKSTSVCSWNSISGTPLWMAPEVLRNEGLDFAADIWSLGCTVIEMATGRSPWGDVLTNPTAGILKIACSDDLPEFPRQFSEEGLDFLGKCLERNPKKRWTAEELLNHPFVTRKPEDSVSRKENVGSPASVLDFGNESGYKSNESFCGKSMSKIPFSMRGCGDREGISRKKQREGELASLENWVVVRSG